MQYINITMITNCTYLKDSGR